MTDNGMDRLDALAAAVVLAAEKVETDREAQEKRFAAADRKALWGRRAAYAALVLAVPALVLGWQVKSAIDESNAQRQERTVISCGDRLDAKVKFNRTILDVSGFDPDTGLPTAEFAAAPPERQVTAREFLTNLQALPICTSSQINLYYESNRTEGVVLIDGAGDDYSEAVTPP